METTRRNVIAMGAALPTIMSSISARAQAMPAANVAALWRALFTGPSDTLACWWSSGTLYAHVDRLREFPVAGVRSIMLLRSVAQGDGIVADTRTIGFFTDLDTGKPTARWHNIFTDRVQDLPPVFVEGPGRYGMTPGAGGPVLTLTAANMRTNRILATGEASGDRLILTQIEGTLQGFPGLDGTLPPLGSAAMTERQTRWQIIARRDALAGTSTRGFFSHVYDALPPWLGFGDALGSGLSKGQMVRAGAADRIDAQAWAYLKSHVPDAFHGDRLALR